MKLSVCIFTYNHGAFIEKAIEGVLMQETSFPFEIVIGEDCSKDNTSTIVRKYEKKFPEKMRVIYNLSNLGMMENNAKTIGNCKGEYIALLDGDDYWINPKKLQMQVDFLDKNNDFIFTFHDGKILKSDRSWDTETCCGKNHQKVINFVDIICDVHIPTFSLVFRKNALGDYPPKWFFKLNAPDRPLFLLLASQGSGYYFNESWGVYRKHANGSWTGQEYSSKWLTHLQIYAVLNKHFNFKFKKPFCRCENQVVYLLAIELLKHGKVKRATCYFRKYLRGSKFLPPKADTLIKIFMFLLLYLKKINSYKQ